MLRTGDQSREKSPRDMLPRHNAGHLQRPMHTRSSYSSDCSANHDLRRSGNARDRSRSPRREDLRTNCAYERICYSAREGSHKRRTSERSISPRLEGSKRRSSRESSRSPRRPLSRDDEVSLRHFAHRRPSHSLERFVVVERQVPDRLGVEGDRRRDSGRDRSQSPVQRRATESSHRTPQSRGFRHDSRRHQTGSAEPSERSRGASGRLPADRHTESRTTHASMRVLHHAPHPSPPPPPAGLQTADEQRRGPDDETVVAAKTQTARATSAALQVSQVASATSDTASKALSKAASTAASTAASNATSNSTLDAASAAPVAGSAAASTASAAISREAVFGPITGENVFVKGEEETDKRRLEQRQRQIDLGKNTIGYDNYRKMVPKSKREHGHPRTPNIKWSSSKRGFDAAVAKWRRALHEWDEVRPPVENAEEPHTDTGHTASTGRGPVAAEVASPSQCAAAQAPSASPVGLSEPSTGVVGGSSFEALLGGVLGGDDDFDDSDVDMFDAIDDGDDAETKDRNASRTSFPTTSLASAPAHGSDCAGVRPQGNQATCVNAVQTPMCSGAVRFSSSATAAARAADAAMHFSDENARTAPNDAVPTFSFGVSIAKAKSGTDRTAETVNAAHAADAADAAGADAGASMCAVARKGLQARAARPEPPTLDASIYLDCDIDSKLVG